MKTLVIGLGNPILGDDGVGWRTAEQVRLQIEKLSLPVEVDYLSLGGLSLMERLVGYENVIIIDAIYSGQKPVGSVDSFSLDELHNPNDGHTASAHDTTLMTALNAGRRLSLSLPEKVQVVAVEVKNVHDFSEELSAPVAASVPLAVDRVMELLGTLYSPKV
jgi:hydrogenase maturation protease